MKWLIAGFVMLGLAACGADGEPETPVAALTGGVAVSGVIL